MPCSTDLLAGRADTPGNHTPAGWVPLLAAHRHEGTIVANRLAAETSPYLLQHAGNPVDWRPWGPEALAAARAENVTVTAKFTHVLSSAEIASFERQGVSDVQTIVDQVARSSATMAAARNAR